MVKINGGNAFDTNIVSHIENPQAQHIVFKNVTFGCETIEDAEGTVFVKRKTGMFVANEYDGFADGNPVAYNWACNVCGCVFEDEEPTYNFCPNCGADMRGEQK